MSVINTVMNAVLPTSRKKLVQASLKSNAFMAWAFSTKRVEMETGGRIITNPITFGRNPNVGTYQYYDSMAIAQTDEFDTVEYVWSRFYGNVIVSGQEQDENKGEAVIFKIVAEKLNVLEESIKEKFSSYLYGAGTGLDPYGLAALIPDDPTTGTLGGISRASESQWRTSSYPFGSGGIDSSNIEEVFDDVLMDLTMKGDKPDLILAGRDIYRTYRAAVRDKLVINLGDLKRGGKGMVDLGFSGIAHDTIPIVYDEDCAVNKAYFINSKYLRLHILKGVNMKVVNLTAPWTMDAIGKRILWQGQFCLWKAFRCHAVISG